MNKTYTLLSFFVISMITNAQVGIGTKSPLTTLDVKEKRNESNVNDASFPDGIIIPKLTATELANKAANTYTSRNTNGATGLNSHEGTMVYIVAETNGAVTIPTSGPSLSKVSEVQQEGFYFYGADDKWHYIGNLNLWTKNSNLNRIELAKNSLGATRNSNGDLFITDDGKVGIGLGNETPTKRLDVEAANGTNTTDNIRIRNLKTPEVNTVVKNLLIDDDGYISKNKDENIEGQILRLPIYSQQGNYITVPSNNEYNLFFEDTPSNAPNQTANLINTVKATIQNPQVVPGQTISKPTAIRLPEGLYKIEVKIIGNFLTANSSNSIKLKMLLNDEEYSEQNFGTNTFTTQDSYNYITGFIYTDIIKIDDGDDLTQSLHNISFKLSAYTNNFKLVGSVNYSSDGRLSYRSIVLIERLK